MYDHQILYNSSAQYVQDIIFWNNIIFIDREAREIMHLVASICPSVCLRSHAWTVWPRTVIFCMEVDLNLGWDGYVGQGRRSRSYAKKCVLHHCYLA